MMKNKRVKQMIQDVMEFSRPTGEENPSYRYKFGHYWRLDGNDEFQLEPYMLCEDGFPVIQGTISLTAIELKG
ncbi:hypothetical protein VPKG_00044 [Vibrio phage pYD21-A]|uniref:hypothetical protein n=1 Tax=Vibrio phage pYD21-A TaxID=754049 RepID=UPI0002C0E2C3|nr:hypothetical protein VPKG_00044 [Vibrio phage pYD21-A]AGH16081.1 hypothetical protein VPKG_00044 [Vibrio phage pYD21-A]